MKLKFNETKKELIFQGDFVTNREFIIDVNWLKSLKPTTRNGLSYFQKRIERERTSQVVNRLEGVSLPSIDASIEKYLDAAFYQVKKYFKPIDKVTPFYDVASHIDLSNVLMAFDCQSLSFKNQNNYINQRYYAVTLFDENTTALVCPRGTLGLVILKNDKVVAAVAAYLPKDHVRPKFIFKKDEV